MRLELIRERLEAMETAVNDCSPFDKEDDCLSKVKEMDAVLDDLSTDLDELIKYLDEAIEHSA